MIYDIVEGTTDILQFQFLENGVPVNLSNISVTLLLEDRTGTSISSPGSIMISDVVNGRIQFTPTNASVFVATTGPYLARWQLTNTNTGGVSYVPSSTRDVWNIVGK